MIAVLILFLVLGLIAFRQVFFRRLRIWQIMSFGALLSLVSGSISAESAISAVNADIMLFLFGVFVVGQAMEESGYLTHIAVRMFNGALSYDSLLMRIVFGFGFLSAFLMNDTCAVIGAPLVILLARRHGIPAKPLLLATAFAVTIGSVPSPIGNPQNLLVAVGGGIVNPFVSFAWFLLLPSMINLFFVWFVIKKFYPLDMRVEVRASEEPPLDRGLYALSRFSLYLIFALVSLKILNSFAGFVPDFPLTFIALSAAAPILVASRKRLTVLSRMDWPTLVFFAALFVLMEGVWETGFFQDALSSSTVDLLSLPAVFAVSVVLSQFISNVPLVSLYLPLLVDAGAGTRELMALAAGSTVAGNLLILGAASNVIVVQKAENLGETVSFFEFAHAGILLTLANSVVYLFFLCFF